MNQRLSFIVVANQNTSMSNNSAYITQLLNGQQVTVDYYIDWQETELKELIHASILKINIGNTKSQQKKNRKFYFRFSYGHKKKKQYQQRSGPHNNFHFVSFACLVHSSFRRKTTCLKCS